MLINASLLFLRRRNDIFVPHFGLPDEPSDAHYRQRNIGNINRPVRYISSLGSARHMTSLSPRVTFTLNHANETSTVLLRSTAQTAPSMTSLQPPR